MKFLKLLKFRPGPVQDMPADVAENFDSIADPLVRIDKSGRFQIDDIPLITETHQLVGNTQGTAWDHLRGKHLVLPDWFRINLDPLSDEYAAQQMRQWKVLSGVDRDYAADLDEAEAPVPDVDPLRRPGFYLWRGKGAVENASHHMLATGMLMKHAGLEHGMWALEYGAGFGHAALAFARMGVNVDTVDISSTFCGYIKEQADFFQVNLTPFKGYFGDNPRGGQKYELIWFYESFHHCVDFKSVVLKLKDHLTPTGKILLAGEPIVKREYSAVPYPWGLRLESEVVATIRRFHWFELGFSEEFITSFFINNGYTAECFDCPVSICGETYSFAPRPPRIELGKAWFPTVYADGWYGREQAGRWTRGHATIALDMTDSFDALEISATNHHPRTHPVKIHYGSATTTVNFRPVETKTIRIDAKHKSPKITFECETIVPAGRGLPSDDIRSLGIYMHFIDYV